MEAWVVWVVIAVVLLVAEATTSAFVAVYFGLAAVATAALAGAGLGLPVQLAAFAILSVGSLLLTRPALQRAAGKATGIRTGVDAMQGRIGVVTRPIAELEPGQVKVGGETWTARCYYDEEAIPLGSRVEVVKVEGVTALVIPAPSPRGDSALEQGESDGR
jgi:membrane protein implicated in regulation of membrane protease activity